MEILARLLALLKVAAGRHPVVASLAAVILGHRLLRRLACKQRSTVLPPHRERVLIIGASSGIGRAIAHECAAKGSFVCIVGRREPQLGQVAEECANELLPSQAAEGSSDKCPRILRVKADCSSVDDMVALRDKLETEWGGLDTLIVSAGVSAVRPMLEVAGLERRDGAFYPKHANIQGINSVVAAATAAMQTNYFGPLISAATFIPMLSSSTSPAVLLVSSLAGVVPAPTRSIYASTKGASLLLYQSLAIEYPSITFTHIIPATVEGDFRASAVDGGKVRETEPNKNGLRREAVAKRCLEAIERGEKNVFMPPITGHFAHLGYWLFPALIEYFAARKYSYVSA